MGFPSSFTSSIFLSTPSARRATRSGNGKRSILFISIHALREEGDKVAVHTSYAISGFLSTPSARRATNVLGALYGANQFLSTPSARRATN